MCRVVLNSKLLPKVDSDAAGRQDHSFEYSLKQLAVYRPFSETIRKPHW